MASKRVTKTRHHSWRVGNLCEGCKRCVRGEKLVLFVTGVCPANCYYCPISEEKKQKDVIYANERRVVKDDDLLAEAKSANATGAGFTGGDPLARLQRTVHYLKLLKESFGKEFHTHLYTPYNLVTTERLDALHDAGLDEIRFHPNVEDEKLWKRIDLALDEKYSWVVGVEIPVLPGKVRETKKLLRSLDGKISFLNLNELEASELNETAFHEKGYHVKNPSSYGVKGSEEAALKVLAYAVEQNFSYDVHYCTCTLKDRVQMGNRLKRQAMTNRQPFDLVDDEGMVTRGVVYYKLLPGYGYEKQIATLTSARRKKELAGLKKVLTKLQKLGLREGSYALDDYKPRLLVDPEWLARNAGKIAAPCAIVTEYPTHDTFPIEISFLNQER